MFPVPNINIWPCLLVIIIKLIKNIHFNFIIFKTFSNSGYTLILLWHYLRLGEVGALLSMYELAFIWSIFILSGWCSPSLMVLASDESPLPTGKITVEEASWIASLVNAGGALGTPFFGPIAKRFGRKNPLIAIIIPAIVSFILSKMIQSKRI